MVRAILWIAVAVLVVVGGYFLYEQVTGKNPLGSGDVFTRSSPSSSTSDNVSNTDLDGKPADGATTTFDPSAPPPTTGSQATVASGSGTVMTGPTATPQDGGGMTAPPVPTMSAPAAAPAATPMAATPMAAMPVADTVAPNPPNGMAFGGTGKYQWYRQGNLTWRVDTASGSSCIAFATNEEWRNPRVLSHGCGNA